MHWLEVFSKCVASGLSATGPQVFLVYCKQRRSAFAEACTAASAIAVSQCASSSSGPRDPLASRKMVLGRRQLFVNVRMSISLSRDAEVEKSSILFWGDG